MAERILLDDLIDGIKARKEAPQRERVVTSIAFAARFIGRLALRSPALAPLHGALQALLGQSVNGDTAHKSAVVQSKLKQLKQRLMRTRAGADRQKLAAQIKLLDELFADT